DRSEKTGYKIREALLKKIPYIIVLGDKDIENGTVSVRRRGEEGTTAMKLDEFIALANAQVESKEIF
ncbi:MAG: threonine--tRNA ligase, partial [Clostridia bacterium]|nr:threonine--tRNA ligase [Clostridia bacterium]